MSPETPTVRQLTRRLISGEEDLQDSPDPAAAAVRACVRVYRDLSRWVGMKGSLALYNRALIQARSEHPLLTGITIRSEPAPGLDGVPEMIRTGGAAAAAAALESLLLTLLGLLGRLVGDDMVVRLVEPGVRDEPLGDDKPDGMGETA